MKSFDTRFKPSKLRMLVLGFFIVIVPLIYLLRLFSMQVLQREEFELRSDVTTRRSQVILAKRGEIYDRNYDTPIASNYNSFVLILNPEAVNIEHILRAVSDRLSVSFESLKRKLPESMKLYQPVELVRDVPYEHIVYFAEHLDEFSGLSWDSKPVRYYSQKSHLAHILGYVGGITPEELQVLYNRGYNSNSIIGKNGIEKTYDEILRGKDGIRYLRVDARGKEVGNNDFVELAPELGNNLVLTIDRNIQDLAVRALGQRIGSVIVLKPSTGEILASVSYPSYDPNLFYGENSSKVFLDLSRDRRSPFLNRAIQAAAAPASTFKVLMSAALLQEEAFPKFSTINCIGWLQVGNRRFNDHVLTGHGKVNLFDALAESCNIYYYTIGQEYLGVDRIVKYSDLFGFGELTGIDLPGEVPGLVPSPQWKSDTFKTPWVGGDTVNMSIGQGFLATTPIQLANMVAGIVNGGTIYQPHILSEIRDPLTYEVKEAYKPKVLKQLDLRPDVYQDLKTAMRGVIAHGTAAPVITTRAVKVAAKTGTAETGADDVKHSWFVSYAPYDADKPEDTIVVVVWVDAVNGWEWWAPKAANIILHGIFTQKNYEEAVQDLQPLWYLTKPEPEVREEPQSEQ